MDQKQPISNVDIKLMQDSLLDQSPENIKEQASGLRTNDLVLAELIIFAAAIFYIGTSFYSNAGNPENNILTTALQSLLVIFGPTAYAWIWRWRSIKVDASKIKKDPQSALTFLLCVWTTIESFLILLIGAILIMVNISNPAIIHYYIGMVLVGIVGLYYSQKSFNKSRNYHE